MSKDPKIEMVKVADLIPYARNSRTHSPEQVTQIAASIKEFGFTHWDFCVENDCYVATSTGDILRVCRRQLSRSGKIVDKYETVLLKGSIDRNGYRTYRMLINGEKKHVKGHRLVLNALVGQKPFLQANHINGKKLDNRLENLEWVTALENNRHSVSMGLWKPKKGINQKISPLKYKMIYVMVKDVGMQRSKVANIYKVCRQTIDTIIKKVDMDLCYG